VDVCEAIINGTLAEIKPQFSDFSTVCKYAVPQGYPTDPKKGEKIFLGDVSKEAKIYYASVDKKDDGIYMSGSRAVAFVGIAPTLEEAEVIAENAVMSVKGPVFHREDIGTNDLIKKRIEHMKKLRN
jgi:phosphoribosylamine--glycine ligase